MKKFLVSLVLLLSPVILFCFVQNASAATDNSQKVKTVVLAKDQIINSDYVVGAGTVDVAGIVNGDVYVAGANITVDGTVNGDLLAAGGNINISGNITGNARIIGGNITVTGTVGKNLSTVGGSLNLTDGAKVGGSVTSAGGNLALYGPVVKDVRIAGGQITLGDAIGGNALISAGQIYLSPNTNIAGNFTYWSNKQAQIASGAAIVGKISQNKLPEKNVAARMQLRPMVFAPMFAGFIVFGKIAGFITSFVVGLLFISFFPLFVRKVVSSIKKSFWANVGFGFVSMIVAPVTIVILFITLFGIPLAVLSGMLFAFSLCVAGIMASIVIGEWAIGYISKKEHVIWSLFVGLVIYRAVAMIPVFGWIFSLVFTAAGLSAIIKEIRLARSVKK